MAAGQGFKTFTTGEVLTAGDVNGYLMQGVLVFASAAARNAAITSPQEGQFAFTKDTNGLWYYDGAAWVASGATGDIEGVTVTSPITGGGTSGTVNIGIDSTAVVPSQTGNSGKYLTTNGTASSWGTVSGGSLTLLSTTTLTGSSVTVSSISGSYANLYIRIDNLGTGGAAGVCRMTVNSVTNYIAVGVDSNPTGVFTASANIPLSGNRNMKDTGGDNKVAVINIYNYAATGTYKAFNVISAVTGASGGDATTSASGNIQNTSAITSVTVSMSAGSFDGSPSMKIYGVN